MRFTNLDTSPMQIGETTRQKQLREQIEHDYSENAAKCSEEFAEMCRDILEKCPAERAGYEIMKAVEKLHRFAYIKGKETDIQIDLLKRTFAEIEHI